MPSTKKSSPDLLPTGTGILPLAPVAALPATLSGLKCSNATLLSLSAICNGLMAETLSGDAMYLALARAEDDALKAGVDPVEYERVRDIIIKQWAAQRSRNPLSGLF